MAPRHLLLLPPHPEPSTYAAVKAAYNAPLLRALHASAHIPGTALEIALPFPDLFRMRHAPRSASFASVQAVLAKVYKLITIIAARSNINIEDSSGVDARVLLLAYPRDGQLDFDDTEPRKHLEGPVIDIKALGQCHRKWSTVFSVESEEGEQILKHFASFGFEHEKLQKVQGGIVAVSQSHPQTKEIPQASRPHYHPAVGGTFDHLHIGHKLLLTMTIFMCDPSTHDVERAVTVGITAEDLLKNKKYAELLEDWHERYANTHRFIHALMSFDPQNDHPEKISEIKNPGPNGHMVIAEYPSGLQIKYTEIWDGYGPTITVEAIDALVISAETRAGGKAVNDKRKEQNWRELDVLEVDVLDADEPRDAATEQDQKSSDAQQAFQNKLSSTEIRKKQAQNRSRV